MFMARPSGGLWHVWGSGLGGSFRLRGGIGTASACELAKWNRVAPRAKCAPGRVSGNSPGERLTISISGCERTHTVSSLIAGKKKAGTNPAAAFTRYVCICFIVPVAAERTRSMFAFLIAAGAMFLAVAVSAAINLAGPGQQR
jgi:hypothetical protein